MSETEKMFPFYGFGNYMAGSGMLGSKLVFLLATDKGTAAQMLAKVVGGEGELVVGSLRIIPGKNIPHAWLMAAAMESSDCDWSSGIVIPTKSPVQRGLLN